MIQCIAIDDEPLALQVIQQFVDRTVGIELAATFTDALSAAAYLKENNVDLLLLDIQMPDVNGLQFYQDLQDKIPVIFTTAFSQYAVDGFNLNALDYLIKPYEFERFEKAIQKAKDFIEYKQNKELSDGFLFVKYNYQWNKIFFKDIELIEALDDYIKIYVPGKPMLIHMSMKAVQEKLPSQKFIRVHRSFIVPIDLVTSWNKISINIGNKTVPVSYTYQKTVQEILSQKMDSSQ
ncbi:MAG: DNA-binding response regulator [Bacteroidetes bacterium]|nr:MAG: DNA-binding response regulator [Bacteroidota bacterium]TAE68331.1 MAG: DNA-binding response regulator [Bacteroidota bacterium]